MADMSAINVSIIGTDLLSPAANSAERSLDGLGQRAGVIGSLMSTAFTAAVAGVAAVGAATGAAIKTAADFEKQMSAVGAVAGATADQMKQLSDLALQLGADTSFSASQAAQGLEELVKAGVSLADIMGGAAKASLDLAAAGGVSVAEAATIASNAMNAFGISGDKMAHVADVISGAANASAIDIHEFGFSLSAAGAVAAQIGLSFDDLAVAIAEMGNAGIKGSDAGTSLKTMFLNLQPSTKQQIALFKELGLITADGTNKFFDQQGHIKSLADVQQTLQDALKGMTDQQKIAALETLFGTDAIRAATVMAKAGGQGFAELAAQMGKVSAADVAAARLDNLEGSIEKWKGSMETASIIVGRAFLPALKRMTDANTAALNNFMPTLKLWAERIPAAINTAVDAIETFKQALAGDWAPADELGPFINAVGNTGVAIRGLVTDWIAAFATFAGIETADITDPWDQLTGAIMMVVGNIQAALMPTFQVVTGQILPALGQVVTVAADAFRTYLWPAIQLVVTEVGTTLRAALDWFATTGGPSLATFITGTVVPALQQWYDWIGPKLRPAITWLFETALPGVVKAGAGFAQWFTEQALPKLQEFAQWLGPKLEAAWTWLTGTAVPAIGSALEGVARWLNEMAIPALTEFGQWLQPKIEAAATWLANEGLPAIGTAASDLAKEIQNAWTWIQKFVLELSNTTVYTDLQAAWGALKDIGAELVRDALGPMGEGFDRTDQSARNAALAVSDITSKIEPFIRGAQKVAEALNAAERAATNAGLALRWYLQMLGIPVPDNPIPNIVPSAPGSQSTDFTPAGPPQSGFPQPPSIVTPPAEEPIQAPPIPPGFTPGATAAPATGQNALARTTPWTEAQVREVQRRIMGGDMPKPPPFDPNKSLDQRMADWAPTLQWLEANTGFRADSLAGLIYAENRFGESALSAQGNNYFSITRSPSDTLALPGTSRFPSYPTPEANIARTIGLLSHPENTNYAPAFAARGGDPADLVRQLAAGGYIVDEPGFPVSDWVRNVQTGAGRFRSAAPSVAPAIQGPQQAPAMIDVSRIRTDLNQFQASTLTRDEALAACGPAAATWFAQAVGRNPTLEEATTLARRFGWTAAAGMPFQGEVGLVNEMLAGSGVSAVTEAPTAANVNAALAAGSPVGINVTPGGRVPGGHYFVATGGTAEGGLNVGATGTALAGGKTTYTLSELQALGGGLNNIIVLSGQTTTALSNVETSVGAVGAAAAAGAPQLAEVGATMQPVVAAFSEGTASVDSLTASIVQSAASQGVATEAAAGYAAGTLSAGDALHAVVAAFAETTPAAAELLAQMDAGTISTDAAAVAFAGLATTTATAAGTVGEMSTAAGDTVVAMGDTIVATTEGLAVEVPADAELMKVGVTGAATGMQTEATASATQMATDVQAQAQAMSAGATGAAGEMASGVTGAADTMGAGAEAAAVQMAEQIIADAQQMAEGATSAAGEMADGVTGEIASMADEVTGIAEEAASGVEEAFSNISIEAPDVGDVIDALNEVQDAAEEAADALDEVGDDGGGDGHHRARGGPVLAGRAYVVGEERPELFVPSTNGVILPRVPAGLGGGDDRTAVLLEAIAARLDRPHITVSGVGLDEVADEIVRRQRQQAFLRGGLR